MKGLFRTLIAAVITLALVPIWGIAPHHSIAQAASLDIADIEFAQLDWYRGDGTIAQADSLYGQMSWSYNPDPTTTHYLNVNVALTSAGPSSWVIQNLPLFAVDNGDFSTRSEGTYFNLAELGLSAGDDLSQIYYTVAVDSTIRTTDPGATVTLAPVMTLERLATDAPGQSPDPGPFDDPGEPEGIKLDATPTKQNKDRDVRGVQEDTAKCCAGAFARSIDWLNRKHNLGMANNAQQIYDDLIAAGVSKPNGSVSATNARWIDLKNKYARAQTGNRIVTKVWDPGDLGYPGFPNGIVDPIDGVTEENGDFANWLKREIKRGEDIELSYFYPGNAHIVTVVGVYTSDGDTYVKYRDDGYQGDPDKGDGEGGCPAVKYAKVYKKNGKYHFGNDRNTIQFAVSESVVPSEEPRHLHSSPAIPPSEVPPDLVCTTWHELHPEYCKEYHLEEHHDTNGNGEVNPCDQIRLVDLETGECGWYHVDEMTITLLVEPMIINGPGPLHDLEPMYIEYADGYETMGEAMSNPWFTIWHEVYPVFCNEYHLGNWEDTNGDGKLSPSDLIDLDGGIVPAFEGELPGMYHILEVALDLVVSPTPVEKISIDVEKWVWDEEKQEWVKEIQADCRDVVSFRIDIHNNGEKPFKNIIVYDYLSESLKYADNAWVWFNELLPPIPAEPDEINPFGDETELVWYFDGLNPCEWITIEFDARLIKCGHDYNEVWVDAYYCEEAFVWDRDRVEVKKPSTPYRQPDQFAGPGFNNGWGYFANVDTNGDGTPDTLKEMDWQDPPGRYVDPTGSSAHISNKQIVAAKGVNPKLALHPNVKGDLEINEEKNKIQVFRVDVRALPGGTSLEAYICGSDADCNPNPTNKKMQIHPPTNYGPGERIQFKKEIKLGEDGDIQCCDWIVVEVDDPKPDDDLGGGIGPFRGGIGGSVQFGPSPPDPEITTPQDGETISDLVRIEEVDLSGDDDILSNTFEYWYDVNCNGNEDEADGGWILIGVDEDGSDGWWVDWDTVALPDCCYIIRATMEDASGQTGSTQVHVALSNHPPQPVITNPADGDILSGTVSIKEEDTSFDEGRDIIANIFEYYYDANCNGEVDDGNEWMLIGIDEDGSDGWRVEWDTTELPDCCYIIRATMVDKHGLEGSTQIHVVLSNDAPVPWITNPSNTSQLYDPSWAVTVVHEQVTEVRAVELNLAEDIVSTLFEYSTDGINWIAIGLDTNGGFEGFLLSDGENIKIGTEGWSVPWDLSGFLEGTYYLRATMTDAHGLTGQDVKEVYYDPTPPLPDMFEPLYGSEISGVVEFKAINPDENAVAMRLYHCDVQTDIYEKTPEPGHEKQGDVGPDGKDGTNRYCTPTATKNALHSLAQTNPALYPPVKPGEDKNLKMAKELAKKMGTDPDTGTNKWKKVKDGEFESDHIESAIRDYLKERGLGCDNPNGFTVTVYGLKVKLNNQGTANPNDDTWYPVPASSTATWEAYETELRKCEAVVLNLYTWDLGADGKPGTPDDRVGGGHSVTGRSVNALANPDGTHDCDFVDPADGNTFDTKWKNVDGFSAVEYPAGSGTWRLVQGIWAISPKVPPCEHLIGEDTTPGDGWLVNWDTTTVVNGYYLVWTVMPDALNGTNIGKDTILVYVNNPTGLPQLTLEPPTADNPVGSKHMLKATLKDSNGNPMPNETITFTVTGVNPASGTKSTDDNGVAEWSYIGTSVGKDTIVASYDGIDSKEVIKNWREPNGVIPSMTGWGAMAALLALGVFAALMLRRRWAYRVQ